MEKAILRLFNSILVVETSPEKLASDVQERTIRNGYLLSPEITPTDERLANIEAVVGISGEKANAAFHKSWKTIRDTPIQILVIQQIIHYMTTYGFESLGIYNKDTVYIPVEALDIPEIELDKIPFVVVRSISREELLAAFVALCSGIALAEDTIADLEGQCDLTDP